MDFKQRVALSFVGVLVTAPAAYVVKRVLGAWGVLDPLADTLGGWLKLHVSAEAAGWTIALVFVLAIYALIIWRVWRPRHIHHLPLQAETAPVASLGVQHLPAVIQESKPDDYPDLITVSVPFEEQQCLGRTFVREKVTPQSLIGIYEGKSNVDADPLAKCHVGRWIRLSVIVFDTMGREDGICVSARIPGDGSIGGILMMYFHDQHEQLSMLKSGDRILVQGEIEYINSISLRLENCQLLADGADAAV